MRALGASVALAVLLLAAAALVRRSPEPPPREASAPRTEPQAELPAPRVVPQAGTTTDPIDVTPSAGDHVATPEDIQVPSQERLHAELSKLLSPDPQQSQRIRDVLDRHAKRMTELLHAERDDAFADRLARARQAFPDELLSVLTAEQQLSLKATPLWKQMVSPVPVHAAPR